MYFSEPGLVWTSDFCTVYLCCLCLSTHFFRICEVGCAAADKGWRRDHSVSWIETHEPCSFDDIDCLQFYPVQRSYLSELDLLEVRSVRRSDLHLQSQKAFGVVFLEHSRFFCRRKLLQTNWDFQCQCLRPWILVIKSPRESPRIGFQVLCTR